MVAETGLAPVDSEQVRKPGGAVGENVLVCPGDRVQQVSQFQGDRNRPILFPLRASEDYRFGFKVHVRPSEVCYLTSAAAGHEEEIEDGLVLIIDGA